MKSVGVHGFFVGMAVACAVPAWADLAPKRVDGVKAASVDLRDDAIQHTLQRAYAQLEAGNTAHAGLLFSQVLEQRPLHPQAIGGMGIVQLRLGQHAQAQAQFEQALRLDEKNAGQWQGLLRTAKFWALLADAQAQRDAGRPQEAEAKVREALLLDAANAQGIALLAALRDGQGDAVEAERLYRQALDQNPANDSAIRGLVMLMVRQGRGSEVLALLDRQGERANVTGGGYTDLRVAVMRDEALHHIQAGQRDQAVRVLQQALELEPADPWIRFDLAGLWLPDEPLRARNLMQEGLALAPSSSGMLHAGALYFAKLEQFEEAFAWIDKIPALDQSEPMAQLHRQIRVRLAFARTLALHPSGMGDAADAVLRSELVRVGVSPLSEEERTEWHHIALNLDLRIAYDHLAAGRVDQAESIAARYERAFAQDLRIALLQGNIARSKKQYGLALNHFMYAKALQMSQRPPATVPTDADGAIAALLARREAFIGGGLTSLHKPGTTGLSDVTLTEVPVEVRYPIGLDGHVFVHIDHSKIQAGALDVSDTYALTRYGKIKALAPAGTANVAVTQAQGTALALGFESDEWRVDVGTTPLGFPVEDGVGGLRWSGNCAGLSCTVDVSKRAMTESLLAYAGAKDPVSEEVWGGVRNTGVEWRVRGSGRGTGATTEASMRIGYHLLTGRNVLGNRQWDVGTEIGRTLAQTSAMQLTAGLAYTFWAYEHDLNYFTFGHGGYYSPQTYHAVSVPWRWSGHHGSYSYWVSGSFSAFVGTSKDMPFYPTRPELQSLAGNPVHAGGSFSGTGYSVNATVERWLQSRWVVGGRLEVERSPYYAPSSFSIYLRYQWEPDNDKVPLSPRPPHAYVR